LRHDHYLYYMVFESYIGLFEREGGI